MGMNVMFRDLIWKDSKGSSHEQRDIFDMRNLKDVKVMNRVNLEIFKSYYAKRQPLRQGQVHTN